MSQTLLSNVGTVVYTKWLESGQLKARWTHSQHGSGVGEATGGPESGFVGEYQIIYRDDAGNHLPEMTLKIIASTVDGSFGLEWWREGKLVSEGHGMKLGEQLVAGWLDV